jgi:proteasome assembly chaperone 4
MTTVSVETKYFPSSGASLPALALQVTCLADSYMLWIGATEEPEENASHAALRGHIGKDWAVAMPPWNVRTRRMEEYHENFHVESQTLPATGTQLLRSSSSDLALSIAKRLGKQFIARVVGLVDQMFCQLARRFGKQIFLSVDVPVSMGDNSGMIAEVEKALVDTLKDIEKK